MDKIFCFGGFYVRVKAYDVRKAFRGDTKTEYFSVWYPYSDLKGAEVSPKKVHFPMCSHSPETVEELKEFHAGLAEFIAILENPPVFTREQGRTHNPNAFGNGLGK